MTQLGADFGRLFMAGSQQGADAYQNMRQDEAQQERLRLAQQELAQRQDQFNTDVGLRSVDDRLARDRFDHTVEQDRQAAADAALNRERTAALDAQSANSANYQHQFQGAIRGVSPPPVAGLDPSFVGPPSPAQYQSWDNSELLSKIAEHARIAEEPQITPDLMRAMGPKMRALAQANGGTITAETVDMLARPEERAVARTLIGKDPSQFDAMTAMAGPKVGERLRGWVPQMTPEDQAWADTEGERLAGEGADPLRVLMPELQNRVAMRQKQQELDERRTDKMLQTINTSIKEYRDQLKDVEKWLADETNQPGPKPATADGGAWSVKDREYRARKEEAKMLRARMDALQNDRDVMFRATLANPSAVKKDVGAIIDGATTGTNPPAAQGAAPPSEMVQWANDFVKRMGRPPSRQEYNEQIKLMKGP